MFCKFATLFLILPVLLLAEEPKAVELPKVVEEPKTVELPKTVGAIKPIELPKELEEAKPVEKLDPLNDIIISGSQVQGNIIINGDTDSVDVEITGSNIQGDIVFDNGCAVVEDTVYECDGTQRKMNVMEKKNMVKRRSQIQRHQKMNGGGGNKKIRANRSKKNKKSRSKTNRSADAGLGDTDSLSPCKSCKTTAG